MKLLRIDASSRTENSDSRKIADQFQQKWLIAHPTGQVVIRDIIKRPIPHISQKTIEGFYTSSENLTSELIEATSLSDKLISELKSADVLLISTPMYNFGTPSSLKAWIDQIVRINATFGINENGGFYGKIENTKAYIVTASGAVYTSKEMKALDFLQPYLQTVLGLIGITEVSFLSLQGTTMDEKVFENTKQIVSEVINKIH